VIAGVLLASPRTPVFPARFAGECAIW